MPEAEQASMTVEALVPTLLRLLRASREEVDALRSHVGELEAQVIALRAQNDALRLFNESRDAAAPSMQHFACFRVDGEPDASPRGSEASTEVEREAPCKVNVCPPDNEKKSIHHYRERLYKEATKFRNGDKVREDQENRAALGQQRQGLSRR